MRKLKKGGLGLEAGCTLLASYEVCENPRRSNEDIPKRDVFSSRSSSEIRSFVGPPFNDFSLNYIVFILTISCEDKTRYF